MYLSDIDIKNYCRRGEIPVFIDGKQIQGKELEHFLDERVKGCSMDLTLANDFKVHKHISTPITSETPEKELFETVKANG